MHIAVLGPFEVRRGDGEVVPLGGPRERAVLAVLALRAGELVSIAGLVHAVWGEDAPASAAKNVQTYVSQLRRRIADDADAAPVLRTVPGGYVLPTDAVEVDARTYEKRVVAARRALGEGATDEAVDHLQASTALWRGEPLADLGFSPVLAAEATRLREVRLAALELAVEADLARGRHVEALPQLKRLLSAHPLRERLWALTMTALYRGGRQAEALSAYRSARELLRRELGVDPGQELRDLERRVLSHDPSLAAPVAQVRETDAVLPATLQDATAVPLVGREEELRALVDAWEKASGTAAVLVAGEPGIGKTRLTAELAAHVVADGALVLHGQCDVEGLVPYQPFVEALRGYVASASSEELRTHVEENGPHLYRLLPELARRLPDLAGQNAAPDRQALFDAVSALLAAAARRRPLLLVLDDMHWADTASLMLLRNLLRLERSRLLVVATYRDTELRPTHPLADTLALLRRDSAVTRISLPGLSLQAVEELAAGTSLPLTPRSRQGLAARVHAETRGNALFVHEVLRHLEQSPGSATGSAAFHLPEGIREAIGRRLAGVSPPCRRILAVAALMGRQFEVPVVAEVAEVGDDDAVDLLDEAVSAHLLEEVPGLPDRYAFPHALVRATLLEELSASRRVRLHGRAAEVLERLEAGAPGTRLVALAHHLGEAAQRDDVPRAVSWTCRAGQLAVDQLAYEEAERSYRRALELLDLLPQPDLEARCDVLLGLGDALARHDHSRARDVLLEAAELARELGSPAQLARAAVLLAGASGFTSSDDPEVRLLAEAERALPADDPVRVEVIAASVIATNAFADHDAQIRRTDDAMALALRLGDDRARTRAALARLLSMSQPEEAEERLALSDALLAEAEAAGDLTLAATAQRQRIWGLVETGHPTEVRRAVEDHRALARRLRDPMSLLSAAAYDGMLALRAGRYDEADEAYGRMSEIGTRSAAGAEAIAAAAAFTTAVQRGRLAELRDVSYALAERYPQITVFRTQVAVVAAAAGDPDGARAALAAALPAGVAGIPRGLSWPPLMLHLSLCAPLLQDGALAEAVYAALLPHADRRSTVSARVYNGANTFHLGRLAATAGRTGDAERHLLDALQQHRDDGADAWVQLSEEALAALPAVVPV